MAIQTKGERWHSLARQYSTDRGGNPVKPDDIANYAMKIMSLMSDAQEIAHEADPNFTDGDANEFFNAAKVMLSNMIQDVSEKERAADRKAKTCIDCGEYAPDGNLVHVPITGVICQDHQACNLRRTLQVGVQ